MVRTVQEMYDGKMVRDLVGNNGCFKYGLFRCGDDMVNESGTREGTSGRLCYSL